MKTYGEQGRNDGQKKTLLITDRSVRFGDMNDNKPEEKKAGLTLREPPPRYSKMKVELRGIKHAAFASDETECFSATVFIDGKKAGTVDNEGRGGSNRYSTEGLQCKLNAIALTLPDIDLGNGRFICCDADILVGDLLQVALEMKSLKRHCAKKTLFRLKGETYQKGEWLTVKAPFSPKVREYLVGKYADKLGEILNETLTAKG